MLTLSIWIIKNTPQSVVNTPRRNGPPKKQDQIYVQMTYGSPMRCQFSVQLKKPGKRMKTLRFKLLYILYIQAGFTSMIPG